MDENATSGNSAGIVVNIQGQAYAVLEGETRELSQGSEIFEGEKIITREGGHIQIKFQDNTILSQGENSEVIIDTYIYDPEDGSSSNLLFQMTHGVFRTITGEIVEQNPDNFNLKSPLALIGIRGTTVDSLIQEYFEQHAVDSIGEGHALVVKDSKGNIQFINDPGMIIDIFFNLPIKPAREMTDDEFDLFDQWFNASGEIPESYSDPGAGQDQTDPLLDIGDFEILGLIDYTDPDFPDFYLADVGEPGLFGSEVLQGDDDTLPLLPTLLGLPLLNSNPVAFNDNNFMTLEDIPRNLIVLDNDSDPDGDTLTVTDISGTLINDTYYDVDNGQVVINTDDTLTYTPDPYFYGTDSFEYTVSDGNGGNDTATVSINIDPVMGIATNDANNFHGTYGDDLMEGMSGDDEMYGLRGNDELHGEWGDDELHGGDGDDDLYGDNCAIYYGHDTLYGDAGKDTLTGNEGPDVLYGGSGDDVFRFTDSYSVDTVMDFRGVNGNENDVLQFIESDVGDTEHLWFKAQGGSLYTDASDSNKADPTAYKIIGMTDDVADDWSDVLTIFNNAVNAGAGNGYNDDSYLIVSNGDDSRVYFWRGDSCSPDENQIDASELTHFVNLEDFSNIDMLEAKHLDIVAEHFDFV